MKVLSFFTALALIAENTLAASQEDTPRHALLRSGIISKGSNQEEQPSPITDRRGQINSDSDFCTFVCPENSNPIPGRCTEDVYDCQCVRGYKWENEVCVCADICGSLMHPKPGVECPTSSYDCDCNAGYKKCGVNVGGFYCIPYDTECLN